MHLADLTERAARSQLEALNWACRGCGEINEFLAAECVSCGCPEDWDPFTLGPVGTEICLRPPTCELVNAQRCVQGSTLFLCLFGGESEAP